VTVRFLVDEDIPSALVSGLQLREPSIEILDVNAAGLRGTKDADLLELACAEGRVLISHDRNTMVARFCERIAAGRETTGLCIVPQRAALGFVIDRILVLWATTTQEQWRNRIEFISPR
jgi:hypothetical protein